MATLNNQKLILGRPAYRTLDLDPFYAGPFDTVETTNLTVTTINGLSYPPPPGTGFVTFTGVETLSNKSLVDNSTFITDVVDPTIRMSFDAAGSAGTTMTIRGTQTANRIYTFPEIGSNSDVILAAGTQTVTGQKLYTAGAMRIANSVDTSVQMLFTAGAAPPGTITTIQSFGQTGSRTYSIPDPGASSDFILAAGAQTLTGQKTFPESARMARAADPTIYIRFIPGASPAGTVTTIATAVQATSRTYTIPDAGANTTFVMAAGTQTLSNKSFNDANTFIVDSVTPSIRIGFDAAGSAATTLTLRATQTSNRTYTFPEVGANTDVVLAAGTQTLNSKLLVDTTNRIVDAVDPTIRMAFDAAGSASTTATIRAIQTADRIYTIPDAPADDSFALVNTSQTLTNKTITSATNTVAAQLLHNLTGTVDVSGSAAPALGNILVATSATTATWQTLPPGTTSFDDTVFEIYDNGDPTRRLLFDVAGSAATTATVRSAQTANRIYTIPDALTDDSFALVDTSQTLANKRLVDTTTFIVDTVDPTIRMTFDAAGSAATTATIRSAQTANRIYTIPDAASDTEILTGVSSQSITGAKLFSQNTLRTRTAADPTSYITWSAGAAALGSVTTITTSGMSGARTYNMPNVGADADFLFSAGTQTMSGKSLVDASTFVVDSVDATIRMGFDATGTTGTTTTLRTAQTADRVITFPSGAVAANVLLSEGNQTANGVNTFTASVVTPVITETVANAGTAVNNVTLRSRALGGPSIRFASVEAGGATNTYLGLLPSGTGAIVADTPDNAATGGNARGTNAIDFQMSRTLATHVASGANSGLFAGTGNTASGLQSGVFSGIGNTSAAANSGVFSGSTNATGAAATGAAVLAGSANVANAVQSAVCSGSVNSVAAAATDSVVCGGNSNGITGGLRCFMGSGASNTLTATNGAVLTGNLNQVNGGTNVVIVGGLNNILSGGIGGIICAGDGNQSAAVNGTFIGAGANNTVNNVRGVIVGGGGNTVSNTDAVVCAGNGNTATGLRSGILCGVTNTLSAGTTNSVIVGGNTNQITAGTNAFIGGGANHVISANTGTIAGGIANTVAALEGFVGGGDTNNVQATATNGVIVGGVTNTLSGAIGAIGGGSGNNVSGAQGTIAGGINNTVSGAQGTIAGGTGNICAALEGFVGGGDTNNVQVAANNGVICGGFGNNVTAPGGVVCGGSTNTAGDSAFVGGGFINVASGQYSGVPYGTQNTASGQYSGAFGRNATASGIGSLTINDGSGTALANTHNNRANIRFADGYRIMTGPSSQVLPVRINNSYYVYSGGQGLTYNGIGGDPTNRWTMIDLPTTDGAIYYEIIMIGTSAVNGQFGPSIPWHRPYETGVIAMGSALYAGTITQQVLTNNRDFSPGLAVGVANSTIGTSVLTGPLRLRINMNSGGAYGNNFQWTGVVKFWLQDFKSPDPIT